jgi:hypothetical protein
MKPTDSPGPPTGSPGACVTIGLITQSPNSFAILRAISSELPVAEK